MRVTDGENQVLALHLRAVAHAHDVQRLLVALGHADDHVVDQRAAQAVQRPVHLVVRGAGDAQRRALDLDLHVVVNVLGQLTLGALDGDDVVIVHLDRHARGDGNRKSADSRHNSITSKCSSAYQT